MSKIKILLTLVFFLGLVSAVKAETKPVIKKEAKSFSPVKVSTEAKPEAVSEAEKEFKQTTESKTIDGTVAGISPSFLAVDYGLNAQATSALEMAMSVDKNTKVQFKKNLKEINTGDTVRVTYEEITETNGKITRVLSRIAKEIDFVKAAEVIQEPPALGSKAPEAEVPAASSLPAQAINEQINGE
jgi:hypothetical protein